MRVIRNSHHIGHAPRHEVDSGTAVPAWEVPARFEAIQAALMTSPWAALEDAGPIPETAVIRLHDPDYVAFLRETSASLQATSGVVYPSVFPFGPNPQPRGPIARRGAYCFDTFTPILAGTWKAALGGATAALRAAEFVATGEQCVYVLTRPPGHHAERGRCGGYSYLNNTALAADHLSRLGPVAVLDIDVHHGNGTQHLFYDRPDIFTVSIHGDPTRLFPYFSGFGDETGTGAGLGFNRNLPLPPGTDPNGYRPALSTALETIGHFRPTFLVVAFGADTHEADPIGGFRFPTGYFAELGSAVRQLGLPTVVVQEGGYNLDVIGGCVVTLLGELARSV